MDPPDKKARISILDSKTHELVGRRELPGLWRPVDLAGDGERLFVSGTADGKRALVVLKLPEGAEAERDADLPPGISAPILSPDGRLLALTDRDGEVQVWDRGRKLLLFAWAPHPVARPELAKGPETPPQHSSVSFAADGRTLATARGDLIKVWDLATPAAKK